jgi:hypothetical protein
MPPESQRGIDLCNLERIILCCEMHEDASLTQVGIEWNTCRPGEVPDRAMKFGIQSGELRAMFFAHGFQLELLSPQAWMSKLGLPGKDFDPDCLQRREVVKRHFSDADKMFIGPRGGIYDGLVEAACIAIYLQIMHGTPLGKKSGPRPQKFRGIVDESQL